MFLNWWEKTLDQNSVTDKTSTDNLIKFLLEDDFFKEEMAYLSRHYALIGTNQTDSMHKMRMDFEFLLELIDKEVGLDKIEIQKDKIDHYLVMMNWINLYYGRDIIP